MLRTCNYGGCLEDCGETGIVVSLHTPDSNDKRRAVFCCAAHAAASLTRLVADRGEAVVEIPHFWRVI
jgi:hypothetical protein